MKATLVLDLPASPTCRADAAIDYHEGLRALQESMWDRAYEAFASGAAKDPACPEVLLRLLLMKLRLAAPVAEQREHLRHALVYRDVLQERDRVLLDSLAATIGSDPPDRAGALRIMADGARRFPNDAELVEFEARHMILWATTVKEMEAALELEKRAVVLHPSYADDWLMRAWADDRLGRLEKASEDLAQCVKASPGAVNCLMHQINILERQGRCDQAEAQIRQWMARDPASSEPYLELEVVIAAEGASREAIEEVARMRLAHMPQGAERAASREIIGLQDRAKLAAWEGDFAGAIRLCEELERRTVTADDPHTAPHLRAAWLLMDARRETGESAMAADLAERFLRRKVAWIDSPVGDLMESGPPYFEPVFLGIAAEGGRLSLDAWRTFSRAWEQQEKQMNAFETWVLRWGSAADARIDIADAIQDAPPETAPEDRILPTGVSDHIGLFEAYEGRLRLLSGDTARAASLLSVATRSCQALDQPYLNTRAHLWLGMAQEKLGHRREACDAYAVVMRRWGKAVPYSVTESEAAKRSRALGCSG